MTDYNPQTREQLVRSLLGDVSSEENLARLFKIALESYAMNGKKLVIAVQDNLGMEGCDINMFLTALEKWKREMVNEYPKMATILDNLIILKPFMDADDLDAKLGDNVDRNDRENNFIFVFAKDDEIMRGTIPTLGYAVRPSYINEDEGKSFTGYYYPLLEIVAMSMMRELLGAPLSSMLDVMKSGRDDFPIEGISEVNGYLIFRIIPKVEPYDPEEHVKRFQKVLQLLRSA